MDLAAAFTACEKTVRQHDPDRYFSTLFAPEDRRPLLFALYAFNHEIARVGKTVKEPMLGHIRLQWWRETMEAAQELHQRGHDVAHALVEVFASIGPPLDLFEAMIDAREFDVSADTFPDMVALESYLDATSGNLMRLAARVLGANEEDDAFAREAGIAYGLAGVLRSLGAHAARGKTYLPRDLMTAHGLTPSQIHSADCAGKLADAIADIAAQARKRYESARRMTQPRHAFAAFLPAALVPLHLNTAARQRPDAPVYRRQLSLMLASFRGRI